jgi:hypothetical protein
VGKAYQNEEIETSHEAAQVRMRDMAVSGRNPGRILGSVLTAFVHEHPGHRVRILTGSDCLGSVECLTPGPWSGRGYLP